MNIQFINNCKKKYYPDPVRLTRKMIDKIPKKFLVGIEKISFYDETNNPIIRYAKDKKLKSNSKIDVYMGGFTDKRIYSVLHFNIVFLSVINNHIVKYLKPGSTDPDIKRVRPHRYNRKWMYLGLYLPIIIPLHFFGFLYDRVKPVKEWCNKKINIIVNNAKNT